MKISKKNLRTSENITFVFIIVVLLVAGWLSLNYDGTNTRLTEQPDISKPSEKSVPELGVHYKNPQIGLEFYYPKDWQVKEEYVNSIDITGGVKVTVKSPSGTTININSRYSGTQPTTCEKNIYDKPHITSSCSTLEVVAKELLPVKTEEGDVFLVAAKFTPPNSQGKSQYLLFLSSDPSVALSQNPMVGAWSNYGTVNTNKIYFDTFLSGIDNTNPGYYRLPEMITANDILKTVNLF